MVQVKCTRLLCREYSTLDIVDMYVEATQISNSCVCVCASIIFKFNVTSTHLDCSAIRPFVAVI